MKTNQYKYRLLISLSLASSACLPAGDEDLGGDEELGEAQQPLTNLATSSFDLVLTEGMLTQKFFPTGTFSNLWDVRSASSFFAFYHLSLQASQPRYYCISTRCNARAERFTSGRLQPDPSTFGNFLVDLLLVDQTGATCATGTTVHALIGVSDTPFGNCPF